MGPHDLLCKWCSTFVGKDRNFCSIFCESRHTRSKRRKLAYKRPVKSSGYEFNQNEYTSPRANKTAPTRKQFLEDVITAMRMEENKITDKGKTAEESGNDDTMSKDSQTSQTSGSSNVGTPRKSAIPRLDMSKLREKRDKQNQSETVKRDHSKPEYKLKSKTHTILDPKNGNENRKSVTSSAKGNTIKGKDKYDKLKDLTELAKKAMSDTKTDTLTDIDNAIKSSSKKSKDNKSKEVSESTEASDKDIIENPKEASRLDKGHKSKDSKSTDKTSQYQNLSLETTEENKKTETIESLPRQQSKMASDLAQRVRSSGYGAPVNPKLRPVSLKPRSANMLPSKIKRESSATSSKSLSVGMNREKSKPILAGKGQSKWELVETPITEELSKKGVTIEKENTKSTLEKEDPSPTSSSRTKSKPKDNQPKRPLQSIDELLREESTGSILDPSVLQERLSSIKKKVEVRRRGRDSRSSYSSDLDSTLDSSFDTTLGKDKLNTSFGDTSGPSSTNRGLRYNYTENDDVSHCIYCKRPLYYPDIQFCSRACRNRKRQMSFRPINIGPPSSRRNRFAWDEQPGNLEQSPNYVNYIPSWELYGK